MNKDAIVASLHTAQMELERALIGLSHFSTLDHDRVRFAAHTLNNYLTVAAATIALLEMRLGSGADDEVGIWLNGLKHATALMTQTSLELLNATPLEREEFAPEDFDLATLVRRGCDFYDSVAGRKQIAVRFRSDAASPLVRADRVAAAAVLDNLLSNAVKFSQPGTRVRVRVYSEPGSVVCEVRDEGPGITPEDQHRLFHRGVRLANIPTGGEPSTGYGLAVAKDLVERAGGEIWCSSRPGHGSTFSFRLPACSDQPEGDPPT
jgi:signal transduction histidine kinase